MRPADSTIAPGRQAVRGSLHAPGRELNPTLYPAIAFGEPAPAASRRARANAQRERVAQALDELSLLSRGVSLDLPLRQAVEADRD
ncbi:MAG TPA: hypothetical protein PKC97_15680 [Burkholderiaceae bacterium]|nr:hypothetical protein [Burkholderiaceae bacterium]